MNTRPELEVRRLVHRLGYRFRLHQRSLPGTPDLVFPGRRAVIFVHGCFWHRHEGCVLASVPASRVEFWLEKFEANRRRDERACKALLNVCHSRKLQIVCTTHSEAIIDAVPRRARVLLRRSGAEHEAIDNVSTRFAVHEMTGRIQPELLVYTEDKFAAALVEESVAGPTRSRISIQDVGSNATLARQAVAHLRMQPQISALSAFDGDCSDGDIAGWINDERAERNLEPMWLRLPGDGLSPEQWVIRELAQPVYREALSRELNCSNGEAEAHVDAMRVQLDEHNCAFSLSARTGISIDDARRLIARSIGRNHPALDSLRQRIGEFLDGNAA